MDLRKKYYKYIQEFVKKHGNFLFMTYEQWLEELTKKLANENSLLCPIGDLDTIQSLLVQKKLYMEIISDYEKVLKFYADNIDTHFLDGEAAKEVLEKWRG